MLKSPKISDAPQHYLEKELKELIAQQPEVFQFIEEGSLDGLWYWDLESPEDEWMNARFWEVLGYNPKEMPHKSAAWQDIINQEDLQVAVDNFQKHLADPDHPYDQIVRYQHKDGSTVWVRCRGMAIRDQKGNALRMLGAHNDVTALKKSEEELRACNVRFTDILNGTNVGTWEWNVQTGETIFNERWAEIIGYTLEELEPISIDTWAKFSHQDDLGRSNEILQQHFRGETDHYVCEARMQHKDGHWVWVQDRGMVVSRSENGEPLWMAGSHIDITHQKELEFNLRNKERLLAKSNQVARIGTWSVDLVKNMLTWGPVTREIHEVDEDFNPELSTGIDFYLEGEDRETIVRAFDQAVQRGISYDIECRIVTAKNNLKWVRSVGTPEMEHGKCIRVYGVFQDITERKEVEIRNQHLLDVATNQNKRLLDFAHIVSHNLRSHAANFKMLLQLLDRTDVGSATEILEHLDTASDSLTETIDNLNEVVAMSHDVDGRMKALDLNMWIQGNLKHFVGLLKANHAEYSVDVPEGLAVMAEPAYLDSVFANLISNAIRYRSPERNLQLQICAFKVKEAGKVQIEFTDNGLGIDLNKYRNKIFGMYKTFHNHPESKGIGLFIVKNQLEAMNGSIDVESQPNEGSTFKILLHESD